MKKKSRALSYHGAQYHCPLLHCSVHLCFVYKGRQESFFKLLSLRNRHRLRDFSYYCYECGIFSYFLPPALRITQKGVKLKLAVEDEVLSLSFDDVDKFLNSWRLIFVKRSSPWPIHLNVLFLFFWIMIAEEKCCNFLLEPAKLYDSWIEIIFLLMMDRA